MSTGEELLRRPSERSAEFAPTLTRQRCSHEDQSDQFKVTDRAYKRQYSHLYFARLAALKRGVKAAALRKWGAGVPVKRLSELREGERCCVIGTLFKHMELKPSILKDITSVPQPPRVKYTGGSDKLVLEDEVQRVSLCGAVPTGELVTGIVVGLMGEGLSNGSFQVEQHCWAGLPPQDPLPPGGGGEGGDTRDKYVLLLSGLNLGSSWSDQLSVEMMVDTLTGQLGGPQDQVLSANVVQVIIAGNSVSDKPAHSSKLAASKAIKFLSRNYSAESVDAVKELDDVLTQLTSCVPVDLMPGSHDPTNHQLPQQPLHRCMFPRGSKSGRLRGATNPYCTALDGVLFLGTSGQNISNIFQFSTSCDHLDMLESTLQWSHLAPTSPDTLGCYPFSKDDPFVIRHCPHVYFAGNQPAFQHRTIQGEDGQVVLLVCVPTFDLSHNCVVVNLRTLACREMTFATSLVTPPNPELERLRNQQRELAEAALLDNARPEEDMSIFHHMELAGDEDDD